MRISMLFNFILMILIFQNCSQVSFAPASANTSQSIDDDSVICNPLVIGNCSSDTGAGLKGSLYFLTEQRHESLFDNGLYGAKINDYLNYGFRVANPVIMSQINVTPRSWTAGFFTSSGSIVRTNENQDLFEWFLLDLSGQISLPAGTYEFATVSDDGMRVIINGNTLINDDGIHAPRWYCATGSNKTVTFAAGEKKSIRVLYFQGPRVEIAMQLLYRRYSSLNSQDCDSSGSWLEISAQAFTH